MLFFLISLSTLSPQKVRCGVGGGLNADTLSSSHILEQFFSFFLFTIYILRHVAFFNLGACLFKMLLNFFANKSRDRYNFNCLFPLSNKNIFIDSPDKEPHIIVSVSDV